MVQIPDQALKVNAASGDLLLIRDTSTNTDKRTTVGGLAVSLFSSGSAYVAAGESTTSATYTDLTSTTDQVSITVPASGRVLVGVSATMFGAQQFCSFAVSGANTIAASDSRAILINSVTSGLGATFLLDGLNPGATTFKMKYRVASGTGNFVERRIFAVGM